MLTYLQVVTTGVEILPALAFAVGPGRFDGELSPKPKRVGQRVAQPLGCPDRSRECKAISKLVLKNRGA